MSGQKGDPGFKASVVIPVRNDPLLFKAIDSVRGDVEVVVAMTSPPDPFYVMAARLKKKGLKCVRSDKIGMASGVNLGVRHATHEKIIILDSDCILFPGAIDAYIQALDGENFVRGRTLVQRDGYWSRVSALGTENLNTVIEKEPFFMGPSIAFRKSVFLKMGGYDEHMIYGSCDHEFALRLKQKNIPVQYVKGAIVEHQPISFGIDVRSHYGYGLGMYQIDQKHGGNYGKGICTKRFAAEVLWTKCVQRGPVSMLRSLMLGACMLKGYHDGSRKCPKPERGPEWTGS